MENLKVLKNIALLILLTGLIIVILIKGYNLILSGDYGFGILLIVLALLASVGGLVVIGSLFILIKESAPKRD